MHLWRTRYVATKWWIRKDRSNDQKLYLLITNELNNIYIYINHNFKRVHDEVDVMHEAS